MSSPASRPAQEPDRRRLGAAHAELRRQLRVADRQLFEQSTPLPEPRSDSGKAGSFLPLAACAVVGIAMLSAGDVLRQRESIRPARVEAATVRATDRELPPSPVGHSAQPSARAVRTSTRTVRHAPVTAARAHREPARPRDESKGIRIRFKWDKPFG